MALVKRFRVLPGFGLALGYTLMYLSLLVLLPLSAVFIQTASSGWDAFWHTVTAADVVSSYRVSFLTSFAAASINVVCGLLLAWSLVRYEFVGKRVVDALIDLPFALPTAVAGITLSALYAKNGWIGNLLAPFDIKIAFTPLGILVALIFIGLPFVVRTLQPVLQELSVEFEEAAATLGANRWQTFHQVLLPALRPAILTGFALAFARAVGEYGSVIFIAGNVPMVSEITPLLIITRLEQFDVAGATAIASVMLVVSFVLLLLINFLQHWLSKQRQALQAGDTL